MNYQLDVMIKILEDNREKLVGSTNLYRCENDIYGLLLKTGQFINAKDFYYRNKKRLF